VGLTYRDSGVDIEKGDAFVEVVRTKLSGQERRNIGLFGGLFDLAALKYEQPILVGSTDGVGTKLLLAKQAGRYDTIGIDLVAMCVNDIITVGAKPLFFLDYMATADLEIDTASRVLDGVIEGCRRAQCTLLGGETAEMPGLYQKGDYELAGFAVGVVEKRHIIDGNSVLRGDLLIGLPSSGIHSNGLSLARGALKHELSDSHPHPALGHSLLDELLIPTRIYVSIISDLLCNVEIHGIAHITGGGLYGNVRRILPEGMDVRLAWETVKPHPVFDIIQKAGSVSSDEMRKTFNMGVGLVLVVSESDGKSVLSALHRRGEDAQIIGSVI
jgi:phosphoribosylformylglycinamidine cyclo-ligase